MATTTRVTAAAGRAVSALETAISEPSAVNNRKAAEAIVALRKQFRHAGLPDWAGRSPEYRDMIERIYRDAGVPSDSGNNFQANLRYHLGNVVRQVAPPEDLSALGLTAQGPLGRLKEARKAAPPSPGGRKKPVMMGDPVAMADAALAIVKALRTMDMNGASDSVEPRLRAVIDESLDVLTELRG